MYNCFRSIWPGVIMATGWKKTTKRSTNTLRLLAQLKKAEPIYLRRVLDFLRGVWEAAEQNNCLTIKVTKTDGFRVYHNDRCVFFMHIDRSQLGAPHAQ